MSTVQITISSLKCSVAVVVLSIYFLVQLIMKIMTFNCSNCAKYLKVLRIYVATYVATSAS